MKKILFLIHDLGGGGAEKVLVNLANMLDREKYDVTVVALFQGGKNERFLSSDVKRYSVWKKTIPGNSQLMKLLTPEKLHYLCVRDKYDIEVSFLEGPSARIISGCREKNTKTVTWIHTQGITSKNIALSFRSREEAERCYRSFDKIVCVSKSVEETFKKIIKDTGNTVTLYNVIDSERILKQGTDNIESKYFSDEEFNIISIGKITQNKGFDRIARIHRRLRREGLPTHVYILGTGSVKEKNKIEKYLQKYGLCSTFTFLGYQSNPYKYLAKADLYVCASHVEGFSTAALESLIVGTPVCTVNVSGMYEMLGMNNEWGVITENNIKDLYREIRTLILDPELLGEYARKAKQRGTNFGLQETISAVERLFDSM